MKKTRFVTEIIEEHKKALIIYTKKSLWLRLVTEQIKDDFEVYESTDSNQKYNEFDLVIFINTKPIEKELLKSCRKVIFVYRHLPEVYEQYLLWCQKNLKQYQIIHIGNIDRSPPELINFLFNQAPVPYFFNFSKKLTPKPLVIEKTFSFYESTKLIMKIIFGAIFFLNLCFLTVYLWEVFCLWSLFSGVKGHQKNLNQTIKSLSIAKDMSQTLLVIPKNTLFWIPGNDYLINIVESTQKTASLVLGGADLLNNYSLLTKKILKTNKTIAEKKEIILRIQAIDTKLKEVDNLYFSCLSIWRKTPLFFLDKQKNEILSQGEQVGSYLTLLKNLNLQLPSLFGGQKNHKYLFLFMNNMELRPGGGFIGSIATVTISDYSLKEFKVYDVYTLDGQLKTHIDPPLPIRNILNQPHWFLRDSAFSPDFTVNADTALKIIEKEVGWTGFEGVVGFSFSAVQKLIDAFPGFIVGGYSEKVTSDNFFIKAQSYAENNFFPGSHGKKNFLEAVVRTMLAKLETDEFDDFQLLTEIKEAFEEKYLVLYFIKPEVQSLFDEQFWTGRLIRPSCSLTNGCFFNYLAVIDANLGVNKANFFIQRTIRLKTKIDLEGGVSNRLLLNYQNESLSGIFPGGQYRNYIQIYLPEKVKIISLKVDDKSISNYQEKTDLGFKSLGFLLTVPESTQKKVSLEYSFVDKILKEQDYELVVQKQIGSINNDFIYEMELSSNYNLLNTNFNSIVQKGGFVYNTFLTKDRILLVRFR